MALGLRDKSRDPLEPRLRRDQMVQQMARNGFLVISDNSDSSYKRLLARSLGLAPDARWGEVVAAFEGQPNREAAKLLADAARRWCLQMSALATFWSEAIAVRPAMLLGFQEVVPDLLDRIEQTWERLQAWTDAAEQSEVERPGGALEE